MRAHGEGMGGGRGSPQVAPGVRCRHAQPRPGAGLVMSVQADVQAWRADGQLQVLQGARTRCLLDGLLITCTSRSPVGRLLGRQALVRRPYRRFTCLLAGLLAYWLTDSAATSASRAKALCGPYAVGSRWRPFRQPASQHHIELCKSRPGRKTHVERRWAPCNRMRLHLHPVIICFPSQLACAKKGSWVHESFTALSVEQKRIRRIAILRPTSSSAAWRTRANGVCQPNHRRSSCLSAPYRNEAPLQHSPPVAMSCLAVSVAAATG